jgi:hypothetical protein
MEGDLSHVLLDRTDEVLASWSHRFDRSALRVPRPIDPRQHGAMVQSMLIALGETVQEPQPYTGRSDDTDRIRRGTIPPQRLTPGGADVRELEKAAAIAGASLSASGLSGFDVAALVLAVRDAVLEFASGEWHAAIGDVFEWLVVIALDSFAAAGAASAQERAAEQLEAGTPVLLITPEVPAVMLVGAPRGDQLDSILGRALLLVVRVGAPTLVLDVSGLTDPNAPEVIEAGARFCDQKRMREVEIALSGATPAARDAWAAVAASRGVPLHAVDRFDAAVARALERAGVQVVRRRV